MPLELGVWRVDEGKPQAVQIASMDREERLETILAEDISIAAQNWMVIGRQVLTPFGGRIDLLAIDGSGNLVVLELKRDKTPREIVAQVLDYASWVKELRNEEISELFQTYQEKWLNNGSESLDAAFCKKFNVTEMPDEINDNHELVVVASALDSSTERIINYLSDTYAVSVNALFFRVFKDGDREYLTRAWLRDPTGVEATPSKVTGKRPWNGEFYTNFGNSYDWDQGQKYGYIAAGGGPFYSRTLYTLEEGARIWVNSPGDGYIGVGIVKGPPVTAHDFTVEVEDGTVKPLAEIDTVDHELMDGIDDPGNENFLVPVEWIKTVPRTQAIKETGFFGNQNSACRPRDSKWEHTVNRLKKRFEVE
ncbi:MAG: hypothetical protein CL942_09195 [Desulfovibrio sp.]|nr:hypothetical protein [Desulfovibrio sp.]|tara:strand:+ start:38294 stop:39388 length:1095 start_codon:yes stop_codon:yes gene_type:complete